MTGYQITHITHLPPPKSLLLIWAPVLASVTLTVLVVAADWRGMFSRKGPRGVDVMAGEPAETFHDAYEYSAEAGGLARPIDDGEMTKPFNS